MTAPSIAIIGHGRMGRAVEDVATTQGIAVRAVVDRGTPIDRTSLAGADVAIEFTNPASAVANARACVDAGCPVVVGTTGWGGELAALTAYVEQRRGALLWAPNFSLGVHAMTAIAMMAGMALGRLPGFDVHIVETHHAAKKDAPSGTALHLARVLDGPAQGRTQISSVRVGAVPGTHEIIFDGPHEQLRITHEVRDRRVFAEGALLAARWLVGRHGVFTLDDALVDPPQINSSAP